MDDFLQELMAKIPNLSEEDRQAIAAKIKVKAFDKGTVLFGEGQPGDECYFVFKGCVRQYMLKNGEEKTTAFYTEGDVVPYMDTFVNDAAGQHFVVCVEDSVMTVGKQGEEAMMYEQFPALESFVYKETVKISAEVKGEFFNFRTSTPTERYMHLLNTRPHLLNRVPQHQIASYIGVTPESLSRIRRRLAAKQEQV